jgi:hypothetical protein
VITCGGSVSCGTCTAPCTEICNVGPCAQFCASGPEANAACDLVCEYGSGAGHACTQQCSAENCTLKCAGGNCLQTCPPQALTCDISCGSGCKVSCGGACKVDCPDGGCSIQCGNLPLNNCGPGHFACGPC